MGRSLPNEAFLEDMCRGRPTKLAKGGPMDRINMGQ